MSEFQNQEALGLLLGARLGEVGYLGGVRERAAEGSLLFDEAEKAHPRVLDILLQLLDAARITVATGQTLDFSSYYIWLTSNIGSAELMSLQHSNDATLERHVLTRAQQSLRPEIFARVNEKLVFRRLSYEHQLEIAEKFLAREIEFLRERGHKLELDKTVLPFLVRKGFHPKLGARPMRDAVEKLVGDAVSECLLHERPACGALTFGRNARLPDCAVNQASERYRCVSPMSLSGCNAPSLRFDNCPQTLRMAFRLAAIFGSFTSRQSANWSRALPRVDVGRDHFGRAGLVKRLHEFQGVTLAFESSERTRGWVAGFLRQPFPRFALIALLQKRIHKDAVNVKGLYAVFARQLGGLAAKPRQSFILCRRCAIRLGADGQPVEIKSFRKQSAVAQPDSVASAEFAVNGGDFDLEFAIVVPVPLDARAVNHPVFADQSSGFIPMAADAVEQSVFVRFFRGADAIFVPDADNSVPAAIAHGHLLIELTVSIKGFLDRGAHDLNIRFRQHSPRPSFIQHPPI